MQQETETGGKDFAVQMLENIEQGQTTDAVSKKFPDVDPARAYEIFRAGYGAGCHDAYEELLPRVQQMSQVLKNLNHLLSGMRKQHDDIAVLNDLTALHSEISGYLVSEADSLLTSQRRRLSRASGVPERYITSNVNAADIPPELLREIGRLMAQANLKEFLAYSMTDGEVDAQGRPVSYEAYTKRALSEEEVLRMPSESKLVAYLIRYGAMQVRNVSKMYKALEDALIQYRRQHEEDASMVTADLLSRAAKP